MCSIDYPCIKLWTLWCTAYPTYLQAKITLWLSQHIAASFRLRENRPDLSKQIGFRAAQLIFMFIICEIVLVFTSFPLDSCSWLGTICHIWIWILRLFAVVMIFFAGWQYYILFNVDVEVINNPGLPRADATSTARSDRPNREHSQE
jgi:hypothetical protein